MGALFTANENHGVSVGWKVEIHSAGFPCVSMGVNPATGKRTWISIHRRFGDDLRDQWIERGVVYKNDNGNWVLRPEYSNDTPVVKSCATVLVRGHFYPTVTSTHYIERPCPYQGKEGFLLEADRACRVCWEGYDENGIHPMSGVSQTFLCRMEPEHISGNGCFHTVTENARKKPNERESERQLLISVVRGGEFRLPTDRGHLIGNDHILAWSGGLKLAFEPRYPQQWTRDE